MDSGLIPLNIELQQDDSTVCCGHRDMTIMDGQVLKIMTLLAKDLPNHLINTIVLMRFYTILRIIRIVFVKKIIKVQKN